MVLSNPPVSQEVDNVIFEEKEINYDFIKDIRNEPEGSHNTSEYYVIYKLIFVPRNNKLTYIIINLCNLIILSHDN